MSLYTGRCFHRVKPFATRVRVKATPAVNVIVFLHSQSINDRATRGITSVSRCVSVEVLPDAIWLEIIAKLPDTHAPGYPLLPHPYPSTQFSLRDRRAVLTFGKLFANPHAYGCRLYDLRGDIRFALYKNDVMCFVRFLLILYLLFFAGCV